jgi:hypothetical protein
MQNPTNLKYILTAQDETHDDDDDKKKIASLQKAMDEKEHELKDAKAKIAKLEADHVPDPHPPVVRDLKSKLEAIITTAMDTEHHAKHASDDDDDDDDHVAKAVKAIMEVFDRGAGTPVGNPTEFETSPKTGTVQGEPATKVVEAKTANALIAQLQNRIAQPIIEKILTAKTLKGASEGAIKADEKRLNQMSLTAIEHEYKQNQVFIEDALTANQEDLENKALIARTESKFDFNGVSAQSALTGNTFSIDKALKGVN